MSLDSPHEHADLLAPVADDECCGGANRASGECRGEGKGRGRGRGSEEGGCCGGQGHASGDFVTIDTASEKVSPTEVSA